MPEISRFLGISILMYYNDHEPAHVHARYGEHETRIALDTGRILSGELPRRARQLVIEWVNLRRMELLNDWELARARRPLKRVEPLE